MPGVGWPRVQPDGCDNRQPECQECRKRGASDPHGFDAGKKIKGKKRHILVDTEGLLMHSIIHGADIQDRDGGVVLMALIFGLFPFVMKLYADSGYTGPKFQQGMREVSGQIGVEIVKPSDAGKFVVLPKRWIVERTLAWISHNRRLARDFERYARSAAAFVRLAMIRIMLKRLTRSAHCS